MLELFNNFKDFSKANNSLPWWPFMMTTVACGAVSGFHATQSPMIAKCIKSEKEGRQIFYGAKVAEGIIALIWAAAAMAFFRVNTEEGWNLLNTIGGSSSSVYDISKGVLGTFGTILAIVGVVICPTTSGDTALRSLRLIVGEAINADPKKLKNRLLLTIPLFACVIGFSIWNFSNPSNFNILWRWFPWSDHVLAAICLWVSSGYLYKTRKKKYISLFTAIRAMFMTAVVTTYILAEPNLALGKWISYVTAIYIGIGLTIIISGFYLFKLITKKDSDLILEDEE
jgi:carbon starvation protein CstA